MNEYTVSYILDGVTQTVIVSAATAALARETTPEAAALISVKFIRAASFSCRIRSATHHV